jgi:nucleoid-associated protein YgaU
LVGEAEEGVPGAVAVGTGVNTPLPPESNTLIEERAATAASPVAETPGAETIAGGSGTTAAAPPTRTFSANPPANKTRVAKVPGYPKKHTIKAGESYWVLATQYYGKGYLHPRISAANKGVKFEPGKVVVIPSPPPKAVKKPKKQVAGKTKKQVVPNPPRAAAAATKTLPKAFYTVKKGDTLAGIAKSLLGSTKYKNRFYAVNKTLDLEFTGDLLFAGMRLRVPKL